MPVGNYSDLSGMAPGIGAELDTLENEFEWGRFAITMLVGAQIDAAATDVGNSGQTGVLRKGLLLGKITSSGNLTAYSATATDGSNVVVGILARSYRMTDFAGNTNV